MILLLLQDGTSDKRGGEKMDKAIELLGLTKKYKNGRGIENVSFEIEKGEIFGFLGPNGAGKTTAMKILTGLSHPDSGTAKINGFDVSEHFEEAMAKTGCIIENVVPYPNLTAMENMLLVERFKGGDEADAKECLARVEMIKFKDEKTKNFSLGMKQRLGFAMAMAANPEIMILDEPLNGLDVSGMVEIRGIIKEMAKEGCTFLISSHLIHDVELTCTKVGILLSGKMVSVDRTENIIKNYSSLENYYLSEVEMYERV